MAGVMSNECAAIHELTNELERHRFPFNESAVPANGIYVLLQIAELGHEQDRNCTNRYTYRERPASLKTETTFSH